MRRLALAAAMTLACTAGGQAAALKLATYGCRAELDAAKAATLQAHNDTAGLDSFVKPKIVSGACMSFGRGVTVDPEQTKNGLTCARLSGGLECYWMADQLIDRHPSDQARGGGGGESHRRR